MYQFLKDLVWNSGKKFQQDNCPQLAAAITYYVIFSLFPLLIFSTAVVGLFLSEGAQQDVVNEVLDQIPLSEDQGRNDVEDAVRSISGSNARALGLLGLAGMAWGGSSMFGSIRRALNVIYREPEYSRPWFQQKVLDLALVLGISVFFAVSIVATTSLQVVRARSQDAAWLGDLSESSGVLWTGITYVIGVILSFVAFVVLYTVVPSRNRNLGNAWPGALVAALLFEVVRSAFGMFVANFKNFDVVFGSLGAVATFMFFVYTSAQIMLFGAEVATVYPLVREKKIKQPRFEGMGVPLRVKLFRAVRSLFVREPPPPLGPRR